MKFTESKKVVPISSKSLHSHVLRDVMMTAFMFFLQKMEINDSHCGLFVMSTISGFANSFQNFRPKFCMRDWSCQVLT